MSHVLVRAAIGAILLVLAGCSGLPRPRTDGASTGREFTTTVMLHGKPLELHIVTPRAPAAPNVVVLYASGDGGWFGAAVDMFRRLADAGYPVVGFSSRAFLKIGRPRGALVSAVQLAAEYETIVSHARVALGLSDTSRVVLAGWSRGAAFSVLVGSEPAAQPYILGVIAIGLSEGEDLEASGADDDSDGAHVSEEKRRWPFDTYARIRQLGPLACAVIQSTGDNYLPAAKARELFGPDTSRRRFYAIDAKNHRFSGGKAAFDAALLDAIHWIASQPVPGI
jgi:Bacterial virulence protein (VirJ)